MVQRLGALAGVYAIEDKPVEPAVPTGESRNLATSWKASWS